MDQLSRRKYDTLLESGIFTYDVALDLLWGDVKAANIMGFATEEMNDGIRLLEYVSLVHPDDLPEFAEKKHKSILNASPFQSSHRLLRKNSAPVWVTVHSRPCRIQNGLPTLIGGIIASGKITVELPL
ncbi:PAS domain-containing protein [Neorhizobium sp. Rsf11]|uniref:PAS domain-containing protein n=2 Tax=Neorhizobium TaxID=1525371 RepID=A0ABV0M3F6_9HYPH|nr:PAS domain-containing protein [Neorhizobium petrolearium]MCC2609526.1 PAS domain-containing protein [Neorhizobium petrolearium]WGI69733.1 PAS domain-containing protein [Neorhizobium petrolearium]